MTDPLDGAPKDAPRSDVFQGAEPDARNAPSGVPAAPGGGAPKAFGGAAGSASASPSVGAAPALAASPPTFAMPRRSAAWRLAGWWLLVSLVLIVVCAVGAGIGLSHADLQPVHVIIDGDDVGGGVTIENAGTAAKIALGVAGLAAAMLVLLLVPVILTLVGGIVVLALVIGLGVPIVALAMALALATSPVWLIALFVWFLARRRRAFAHATSATMTA
jgi:hypothetical protein